MLTLIIEVFDSRSTVGGEGLIVLAVAQAAAEGKDTADIIEAVERTRSRVNYIAMMDALSYLARSGRIGRAAALAGNLLSVKPIVEISTNSGSTEPIERVRTRTRAVERLLEIMRESRGKRFSPRYSRPHSLS